MKVTPIFSEYIFEFDYSEHDKYKDSLIDKIKSLELYYEPLRRQESFAKQTTGIITTHPDLHKEDLFVPIRDYMHECINRSMGYLGFKEQSQITSMWSNIQNKGSTNPIHSHYNTYLTALYYLHSSNGMAEGTTFHNASYDKHSIITPPFDYMKEPKIRDTHQVSFKEGKVIVFHGFLKHSTNKCIDNQRIIIGMNTMPVGDTNRNPWDRFSY